MTQTLHTFRFELHDSTHGTVPCTALAPPSEVPLPLCLFLFGGGGTVETLIEIAPLVKRALDENQMCPMAVACAGAAPWGFYIDDPERGMSWETLVAEQLPPATRACIGEARVSGSRLGLVGVSMGGYGALKIALGRPEACRAVAAVAPMIEPSLHADETPLRNRFHYPPDVPPALLGNGEGERDGRLFERDHPARRAHRNAARIAASDLAIWLDAGTRDACHAHDGTEFLHRTLWNLDIPHEYHLLRDADHVGASLAPRLVHALTWVSQHLAGVAPSDMNSPEALALRAALAPAKARALTEDPALARHYGPMDASMGSRPKA